MKIKRKTILIVLLSPIVLVFLANYSIQINAVNKTFTNVTNIKHNKVGLVLGTSKYLANGYVNRYFTYRINAAVELYKNGKIDFVLVSGDNSKSYYDEPSDFKAELIKKGIPENKIFLDYAGFRTLDSVVRAKEIFGQSSITIISQKFHNERAIYLAEKKGIDAVGFNAQDLSIKSGLRTRVREYLARTKAYLDIIFRIQPKFLGEKIAIE